MRKIVTMLLSVTIFFLLATPVAAKDDVCGPAAPEGNTVTIAVTTTAKSSPNRYSAYGLGKDIPAGTQLQFTEVACDKGVTFLKINWDNKDLWLPNQWPTFGTIWGKGTSSSTASLRCAFYDEAGSSQTIVRVVTGCLRVRSGAGTQNSIIAKATRGSRFEWISTDNSVVYPWHQIRLALGKIGWVAGGYNDSYSQVE